MVVHLITTIKLAIIPDDTFSSGRFISAQIRRFWILVWGSVEVTECWDVPKYCYIGQTAAGADRKFDKSFFYQREASLPSSADGI